MLKGCLSEANRLFFSEEPDWHWGLFGLLFSFITIRYVYNIDLSIVYSQLYYPLPLFEVFHIPSPYETKKFMEKFFSLSLSLKTFFIAQKIIFIVSLIFSVLGIGFQRFWLAFSLLSFFIFQGYIYGFVRTEDDTYVYHSANIVVFILLIWLVSPLNQRWTTLFWIKRFSIPICFDWYNRIPKFKPDQGNLSSSTLKSQKTFHTFTYPKWPRLLIILTMGIVYFGSFYCKLTTSGFQWVNGHTLQSFLLEASQLKPDSHAYWLASQNFFIIWFFNISVWIFQSTAPIGFLLQKTRLLYGIMGVSFHTGIFLFLGFAFVPFQKFFVILIPELFQFCYKIIFRIKSWL